MTTTFEVTVHIETIDSMLEMIAWCDEHTSEYDYAASEFLHAQLIAQLKENPHYRTLIAARPVEQHFYFFNELDAIHFKLRFAEFL